MRWWTLVSIVGCNSDITLVELLEDSAMPALDTGALGEEVADELAEVALDSRVDPTLSLLLLTAAHRERGGSVTATTDTETPVNLDPSTAHAGSLVELFIEGAPDLDELEDNG